MEAAGGQDHEDGEWIVATEGRVSTDQFDHELRGLVSRALAEPDLAAALADTEVGEAEAFNALRQRMLGQRRVREEIVELALQEQLLEKERPAEPSGDGDWTRRATLRTALVSGIGIGTVLAAIALVVSLVSSMKFWGPLVVFAAAGTVITSAVIAFAVPRRERQLREEMAIWRIEERELRDRRGRIARSVLQTELRSWINELRDPAFGRQLTPADASGLRELFDPRYDVPVKATTRLEQALGSIRAGSIGIAGPRGVGKTTLIRAACEGRLGNEKKVQARGLAVSAPIRYGGQEFVRFLFTMLCLEVVPGELGRLDRRRRAIRRQELTVAVSGFAIFVGLAGIWTAFSTKTASQRVLLLAAFALVGMGALLIGARSWRRWWRRRRATAIEPIEAMAEESLARLRYSETQSEEAGVAVSYRWLNASEKRGRSRAEQPWSYPEVIAKYREFVALLGERRPLVIGIDELDKMTSAEEARSFLNEMKSLFDQEGVSYLVSVSEEALSDFERRGQPLRDVFDSVFSDILHVDYLNRAESEALLRRRAIGIPPPWPALFHALAGGLPRESIRVARSAVRIAERGSANIDDVAAGLIGERCASHEHAAEVVSQGDVGADGRQPVLEWLARLPRLEGRDDAEATLRGRLAIGQLIEELRAAGDAGAEGRTDRMERLVVELAAGWFHSLTCLEFFSSIDESAFGRSCEAGEEATAPIDLLAQGHQNLSRAPALAWKTVSDFRSWAGLEQFDYPVEPRPR